MSHNTLHLVHVWCAQASKVFSRYWAAFRSQLQVASWGRVLVGCFMLLIAGIVLHLTVIAKLIVAITMLSKLFLHHSPKKKVIPILEATSSKSVDGEIK